MEHNLQRQRFKPEDYKRKNQVWHHLLKGCDNNLSKDLKILKNKERSSLHWTGQGDPVCTATSNPAGNISCNLILLNGIKSIKHNTQLKQHCSTSDSEVTPKLIVCSSYFGVTREKTCPASPFSVLLYHPLLTLILLSSLGKP